MDRDVSVPQVREHAVNPGRRIVLVLGGGILALGIAGVVLLCRADEPPMPPLVVQESETDTWLSQLHEGRKVEFRTRSPLLQGAPESQPDDLVLEVQNLGRLDAESERNLLEHYEATIPFLEGKIENARQGTTLKSVLEEAEYRVELQQLHDVIAMLKRGEYVTVPLNHSLPRLPPHMAYLRTSQVGQKDRQYVDIWFFNDRRKGSYGDAYRALRVASEAYAVDLVESFNGLSIEKRRELVARDKEAREELAALDKNKGAMSEKELYGRRKDLQDMLFDWRIVVDDRRLRARVYRSP